MSNSPFFSIVIPTLNEEKFLPLLLADLVAQTFHHFEVIHVDGDSTDQTINISKTFSDKMALRIFHSKKRNAGWQRNLGAKNAMGKWIVFMDADNRLNDRFLFQLHKQLLRRSNIDLFTCLGDDKAYTDINEQLLVTLFNFGIKAHEKIYPVAVGSLIGVNQKVNKAISFQEKLPTTEDYYYIQEAIKHDFTFKVLQTPKYTLSLRRVKKDGIYQVARAYFQNLLVMTTNGKVIKKLAPYSMDGGANY